MMKSKGQSTGFLIQTVSGQKLNVPHAVHIWVMYLQVKD
jgi:hypothetical protein